MVRSYNNGGVKSKIRVVSVLPAVKNSELGEMVFLTGDSKIYVKIVSGWVKTAALA